MAYTRVTDSTECMALGSVLSCTLTAVPERTFTVLRWRFTTARVLSVYSREKAYSLLWMPRNTAPRYEVEMMLNWITKASARIRGGAWHSIVMRVRREIAVSVWLQPVRERWRPYRIAPVMRRSANMMAKIVPLIHPITESSGVSGKGEAAHG